MLHGQDRDLFWARALLLAMRHEPSSNPLAVMNLLIEFFQSEGMHFSPLPLRICVLELYVFDGDEGVRRSIFIDGSRIMNGKSCTM